MSTHWFVRASALAALVALATTQGIAQPTAAQKPWYAGAAREPAAADEVVAASDLVIQLSAKRNVSVEAKLPLPAIQFELGTARLTALARRQLDEVKLALTSEVTSDIAVYIDGHTDARGSDAFNEALSHRRAKAAVDYLVASGIAPGRLEARGYGETEPLPFMHAENAANRRVEISRQR